MVSPDLAHGKEPLPAAALGRPSLLIVSDALHRLTQLRAALDTGEVAITSAASLEELPHLCECAYDLVVVDVCAARLVEVLKALRERASCAEVSILVDAGQLTAEAELAGVFPRYRAMPCSRTELITLARRRLGASDDQRALRKML
jgi:hypothetical protein